MRSLSFPVISGVPHALFLTLFSSLSYYGVRAVLLIYLLQTLNIPAQESLEIFGAFISLHYVTQILCGWVSDHYLGNQKALWLGGILIFMGGIFTGSSLHVTNFIGFGLFVIGTSLSHVNLIALVGKLHDGKEVFRDMSFTLVKVFGNLGLLLGTIALGSLFEVLAWKNSILMGCGLSGLFTAGLAYVFRHKFGYHGLKPTVDSAVQSGLPQSVLYIFYAIVLGLVVLSSAFLLWKNEWLGLLVPIFAVISLILALHISLVKKVFTSMVFVVVLFIFSVIYLSVFHHASTIWILFVNSNLDRSLPSVLGVSLTPNLDVYQEIPLIFVKSLNAIFIVLIGPVMAYIWYLLAKKKKNPSPMAKFSIGFCLAAISFAILSLSKNYSSSEGMISVWWFFLAHFFYALGEIMILPIGLSFLTRIVPRENMTLLVGIWLMAGSISLYINKYFTKLFFPHVHKPLYDGVCSLNTYCDAFGLLSWICFFCGGIAFIFSFVERQKTFHQR